MGKYWDPKPLFKTKATYLIAYGQRGNGKTYGVCDKIVDEYIKTGTPSAYIRRLDQMIKAENIATLFDELIPKIKKLTNDRYNTVFYRQHGFYMAFRDPETNKLIDKDPDPFCRTYSLNTVETTKGADRGKVKYIVFDEFITRGFYLTNEFILFQNLLSSLIRNREGAIIVMLANTVNRYACPYFKEMGLTRITKQQPGTIDLYQVGTTKTSIAVEYCDIAEATKKVTKYFAFDNPELNMITAGAWEMSLYRHPPKGTAAADPEFEFFVIFDSNVVRGAIYLHNDNPIIIFSPKTTEIKDIDNQLIYSDKVDSTNPLHQSNLMYNETRAHQLIINLLKQHKTYFASNDVGEIVANWLRWATKGALTV